MGNKIKPIHERKGFAKIDPDETLNELIEIMQSSASDETLEKFFPGRGQFFRLHRWIEEKMFERDFTVDATQIKLEKRKLKHELAKHAKLVELPAGVEALSHALLKLAYNKKPDFFEVDRRTGDRTPHHYRTAVSCAMAVFNDAQVRDQLSSNVVPNTRTANIQNWWKGIVRKLHLDLPEDLSKKLDNTEQEDGATKDKAMLMALYSPFINASAEDAAAHTKLLKGYAESLLQQGN